MDAGFPRCQVLLGSMAREVTSFPGVPLPGCLPSTKLPQGTSGLLTAHPSPLPCPCTVTPMRATTLQLWGGLGAARAPALRTQLVSGPAPPSLGCGPARATCLSGPPPSPICTVGVVLAPASTGSPQVYRPRNTYSTCKAYGPVSQGAHAQT